MSAAGQTARVKRADILPKGRSALAHLLHALNQPLTGLQCSLELALVGHNPENYVRAMRDGLELVERMRVLVEAIRELEDVEQGENDLLEIVPLELLLRQTAEELAPVAETKAIRFELRMEEPMNVRANRRKLGTLFFRLLDSLLSLAAAQSTLQMDSRTNSTESGLQIRWMEKPEPLEHSPFSRPELGLLIARAGWVCAGGDWEMERSGPMQVLTLRLPRAKNS